MLVKANPPSQSALRAVTDVIAANPAADHSVKSIAAHAALSTRQLTRLFRSELGTTSARYVEMVRINAARGALDAVRRSTSLAGAPPPTATTSKRYGAHCQSRSTCTSLLTEPSCGRIEELNCKAIPSTEHA